LLTKALFEVSAKVIFEYRSTAWAEPDAKVVSAIVVLLKIDRF